MGKFFKGWRWKIGVLTLVMACVLMGGWMRSFVATDVWFASTSRIASLNGNFEWMSFDNAPKHFIRRRSFGADQRDSINGAWAVLKTEHPNKMTRIPYWSIVLSLTLLSAYLLLAKPKKAVEPTTADGA